MPSVQEVAEQMIDPRHAKYIERAKKLTPAQRKKILALARPRMVDAYAVHIPHPKQQIFLALTHNKEVMFGGAAGGGKSDALLMAALQYVDVPGYSALIIRRTWPDLNAAGAILDRANSWLTGTDAHKGEGGRIWTFPSGARLSFGYVQYDKDKYKFQSAEYQFVGFDELTQFEESQYSYLFSRIRRPRIACLTCGEPVRKYEYRWKHTTRDRGCRHLLPDPKVISQYGPAPDGTTLMDVPLRMRSATNPGGIGHEWVRDKFIDAKTRDPASIFIPSLLTDNPSLDQTSYIESLMHLSITDRERLLAGDWDVMEQGEMFQRHWFNVVDQSPTSRKVCRYWDMAAAESSTADWTVGAKVVLLDGRWYIDDIIRVQISPAKAERLVLQTAAMDGREIPIRMEQEPGSSGMHMIDHYRRQVLAGFNFDGVRPTGSKATRAQPWSVAAEAGNVFMRKAMWNKPFLDEASLFPNGAHDDQIDAVSGAVEFLAFGRTGRLLV